jgi:hypothetical protein
VNKVVMLCMARMAMSQRAEMLFPGPTSWHFDNYKSATWCLVGLFGPCMFE